MRPSRLMMFAGTLAAAGLLVAACGGDDSGSSSKQTITVGSADFPESQLLGEIYAQALEAKGFTVKRELNIGPREVYFQAIVKDEVQVLPEYTNSLLSFVLRQSDPRASPTATDVASQLTELGTALPDDLQVLTPSSAEDKDTIVCTADVASQYGLTDLTSLFAVSEDIKLGAPAEFEDRAPFGIAGFAAKGATFKEFVPLQYGAIADALKAGQIDCANIFSTDPAISTNGFVALDDDLGLVPNEAVVPLVRTSVGSDDDAVAALDAVSAALTTEELTEMVGKLTIDAEDPAAVAKQFVADHQLG